VIKLCALLRLADSIDISHTGYITDVSLMETKLGWRMKISGKSDLMLENWAFEKRKSLFQEVFDVNLELDV
jgi:exopolyphosphatase/guanosine-5'-triphosphate,3'-diphosphate pyrophosphatase